jgi:hypothetical protein
MITKFFIAGMEIPQPQGLNGFYLERFRDKVFNGFIRQRTSSVKGIGQVMIKNKKVTNLLRQTFLAYGIDAVTEFRIEQDNRVVYLAEVDYGQYSTNHNGYATISFRDTGNVVGFDVNVEKEYDILPTQKYFLEKTKLTGKATHTLEDSLKDIVQSVVNTDYRRVLLSVPMKVSNKDSVTNGIGLDVKNITGVQSPFWKNSDTKPVKITVGGILNFDTKSSDNDQVTVYLLNRINGNLKESKKLFTFENNNTLKSISVVIDEVAEVGVGGDVVLFIEGTSDQTSYTINFKVADLVVEQDLEINGSEVYGMKGDELLRALLLKMQVGYTLNNQSTIAKKIFITNGYLLRNTYKEMTASFMKVFRLLNKLSPITLNIKGDEIIIKDKQDDYKNAGLFVLKNVSSSTVTAMSEMFATEVKLGYSEWKSETILGNLEYNSTRVYDTAIKKVKGTLDYTINEAIASGRLIERQRRLQYNILKNNVNSDDKYDKNLFCMVLNNEAVQIGANGVNEEINPVQLLKNHLVDIGHLKDFYFRTADGNANITVKGTKQNANVNGTIGYFTGNKVMVQGNCTIEEYANFGDKALFKHDGSDLTVWVTNDLYRIQTNTYVVEGYEIL